jgi:primosomal protein N'
MLIAQSASRQYLHSAMQSALATIEAHPNGAKIRWSLDVAPLDFT